MTVDIIKLQTTWNDAAAKINGNFAKIAAAITQIQANGGGNGGSGEGGGNVNIDLSDYAQISWVTSNYLTKDHAQSTYARKDDLPQISLYYTKTEVEDKLEARASIKMLEEKYAPASMLEKYLETETANNTYLGKTETASNSSTLEGKSASYFATAKELGDVESTTGNLSLKVDALDTLGKSLTEEVISLKNDMYEDGGIIEDINKDINSVKNSLSSKLGKDETAVNSERLGDHPSSYYALAEDVANIERHFNDGNFTISGDITCNNLTVTGEIRAKRLNIDGIIIYKDGDNLRVDNGVVAFGDISCKQEE